MQLKLWFPIVLLFCGVVAVRGYEDTTLEDDDFAEFEQFDADDDTPVGAFSEEEKPPVKAKPPPPKDQFEAHVETEDEILVEDDEDNDEFEHFQDPEEFEGFPDSPPRSSEQPKIIISKVPIMVRPRWDAYWLEGILCCLLAAYALAYAIGRAKNTSIASNFLKLHKPLLDDNFTLVGESGSDVVISPEERGWRREAEHVFTMWCSGRMCCEGMLLTLKLIKRQDLVHVVLGTVRPSTDTLTIRVELGKDDGDPFVLCVAQKKHATRLAKEMHDLSVFCPEKRPGDKHGLPAALAVLSECAEATGAVLDARTQAALSQYHTYLQYIHISDRYAGPKQMEETAVTKPPETEKVMLIGISLGPDGGGDEVRPLLLLVFHLLDKIKRLRLSKEALLKCEKRRQKVAEAWLRGAHAARQEQAAARREEKRKQEKERILAEDDPEKQRRWELKEQKRQQKRKTPKMKQLKSVFCPEKRPGDKHGLPAALAVLSECAEATGAVLDARTQAALSQYHTYLQYIHISDRYAGPKQMEETAVTKPPETEKVMLIGISLGPDGGGDEVRPLLLLVFHLLDKIKRLRLSKEALLKCEKRRQKVAEAWLRGAHAARQEQAAARREEKRKQEKERILAEDDPEKQRRWELKEQKRQQKRKTPKMKQLKVKAL